MGKAVRKFLLRLILEKAIAFEENVYRFYEDALAQSAMIETAELLRKLLSDELRHSGQVRGARQHFSLYQTQGPR